MAKLIYSSIMSLDGYIADEQGNFDWAAPDEDVHAAVNDLQRLIGTMLLGRRMYEVLVPWETMDTNGEPSVIADFAALWRETDKVVYSRTLEDVPTERTRLERDFDPETVRRMKASAERDLSVGGPDLAASAFAAGLVDEWHLFLNRSSWAGARPPFPTRCGCRSSCSTSAASRAASSTSTTEPRACRSARERPSRRRGHAGAGPASWPASRAARRRVAGRDRAASAASATRRRRRS